MRLCFFGDSFVNGTGDPQCLGWAGRAVATRLAAAPREVTVYNLGIRRDTSQDIAARWHDEAARRLPAGIDARFVFSFGVNDCVIENGARRVAPEATLAAAETMLRTASARGKTLFVSPPAIPDASLASGIGGLSQALQALCERLRVPFLDVFTPLSGDAVWLGEAAANDGAHPGAAGYARLAALVEAWPAWQEWWA